MTMHETQPNTNPADDAAARRAAARGQAPKPQNQPPRPESAKVAKAPEKSSSKNRRIKLGVGVAGMALVVGGAWQALSGGGESSPEPQQPVATASQDPSVVETTEPTVSSAPTPETSDNIDGSTNQNVDQIGDFEQYRSLYKEFDPVLMALQNEDKETLNYVGVSVRGCMAAIETMQQMLNTPEAPNEYLEWQDTSLKASISLARKLIQSGLILAEPPVVNVVDTARLFAGVDDNGIEEIKSNLSFFVVDKERVSLTAEEEVELRALRQPSSPREKIWMDGVDSFMGDF